MGTKTHLNFADAKDYSTVLDYFGGEEHLKNNFPNILQMIHATKELQEQRNALFLGSSLENDDDTNDKVGYEDTYEIAELTEIPTEAQQQSSVSNDASEKCSSIYARSTMSLVDERSFLHMSYEISDPEAGKVFYANAVHDKEKSFLEVIQRVSGDLLNYSDNVDIQMKAEYLAVKNVDGKSVMDTGIVNDSMDIKLLNMKNEIKNISVSAPKPKHENDRFVKIVYKDRTDNDAAYIFKKAQKNDGVVTVYFPFSIQVELDDDLEFDKNPIEYDQNFYITLSSNVIKNENGGGGGEVHFNETYKRTKLKASAQGNILTLSLPYDSDGESTYWGTDMALSGKQASGYFDFYLNVKIYYHYKNSSTSLSTAIVVTSVDLPDIDTSPNMYKVKESYISWGCLGKNTRIMTKQGEKIISELCAGDVIITDKGESVLKQLITGKSERILAIGTCEEDAVLLTCEHPICTQRGLISAGNLTVNDLLKTTSGDLKEIGYLAGADYSDTVYSLELEQSGLVYANGYLVGDYKTAPLGEDNMAELHKKAEPIDKDLLEELERWSLWKAEQLQKTVNV